MHPLRRVFFLTYYFPPLGGAGAIRAAKMAKFLPDFGWEPVIFHAGPGNTYAQDSALLRDLPATVRRIPVRTFEMAALTKGLAKLGLGSINYRIFRLYPIDPQIGWLPFLRSAVKREIEEYGPPEAVFTSSAPHSTHLEGLELQRSLRIPWVADFRDEWTLNPGVRFLTPVHRRIAHHYETEVVTHADAITTVTQTLVDQFNRLRPQRARPVDLIRNGFDGEDFERPQATPAGDKWTLGIVGTVYDATDPGEILQALGEATRSGHIDPERVRVVHAGRGQVNWPAGAAYEKQEVGMVTHPEAIAWMLRCDLLLLSIKRASAAGTRIYEYLRSGRPILAVVPQGEASQLIEATGAGQSYAPGDRVRISEHLIALFEAWSQKRLVPGAPVAKVDQFSRYNQTKQLADILTALAGR